MDESKRLLIKINGVVQGVGFRPFVYQLANQYGLGGCVYNTAQGLVLEVEGAQSVLELFQQKLIHEKPALANIQSIDTIEVAPNGDRSFSIIHSDTAGAKQAWILPDVAICQNCLRELFDPQDRRFLYPFINCTHCGPRFSIIENLPYDRPNTTMKLFDMCDACRREYEDPLDRRFHAQPIACPNCGPSVILWNYSGKNIVEKDEAVHYAVNVLKSGKILALKGLGGFQLLVDATNEAAVQSLRLRKQRKAKPFAVMVPDLEWAQSIAYVSNIEMDVLNSVEAPIVLLKAKPNYLATSVAPGNPYIGIMLPTTPLHHLIMREFDKPVVATSGNLSDEPICIDEYEALKRLNGIADYYLVHNRPIVRPVDDSVVQVIDEKVMLLRRARGYAPFPIYIEKLKQTKTTLAVGSFLKNSIAINSGPNVFISQHIGDLETLEAQRSFESIIEALKKMYELNPEQVALDLHPDYSSSQYAKRLSIPKIAVQHHHAHVLACMAEHDLLEESVLGISWDGTGLGTDHSIWGGEFLLCNSTEFKRVAHLKPFILPSGDQVIHKPYRTAFAILHHVFGQECLEENELPFLERIEDHEKKLLLHMINKQINCPITSSMGRLFDVVSVIADCCYEADFEGQAAMLLEFAIDDDRHEEIFPYKIVENNGTFVIDWQDMIRAVVLDVTQKQSQSYISLKFHNTLVEIMVKIVKQFKQNSIILTGGCFQNKYLLNRAINRLRQEHIQPYWPQKIPTNDGGIALGQLIAATME